MIRTFSFDELDLKGAYLIKPFIAYDDRGYFIKDYSKEVFEENGIYHDLKEVFYTNSKKGVIRAIHFQRVKEQAKLVRCVAGEIYDVIVDLRPDSKTYGQWQGFYLSEKNMYEIYVPKYFGHGYLVIENSIVSYKCDVVFHSEGDSGIIYNDASLNITWPFNLIGGEDKVIISEKDKNLMLFNQYKEIIDMELKKGGNI